MPKTTYPWDRANGSAHLHSGVRWLMGFYRPGRHWSYHPTPCALSCLPTRCARVSEADSTPAARCGQMNVKNGVRGGPNTLSTCCASNEALRTRLGARNRFPGWCLYRYLEKKRRGRCVEVAYGQLRTVSATCAIWAVHGVLHPPR